MKNVILACTLIIISLSSSSQTCELREEKLIECLGAFTAGYLYNTYGLIGSVSDAFANDVYDAKTTNNLLGAQKKVLDNLGPLLDSLVSIGTFSSKEYREDVATTKSIFNGLKKQIDLMLEYIRSKTPQRLEAFEEQRKKNWSAISKMMGIDE
jgi:hypothetical protein